LNNFKNCVDTDKINSQLDRADIQKRILIKNIYREYELYLNLVRDLLPIFVEKGLNQIYSYPTINDNFLKEDDFYSLFEKKISKSIFTNLPFLTVEQLKINEIEENINKEINLTIFDSSTKKKDDQKEKFQCEDGFQLKEPIQFEITKDISNTSEYYQAHHYERFESLDLDNNHHNNYLSKNNLFENLNTLDPLNASFFSIDKLSEICDRNETYAAKDSLNSELIHWQHGKKVICRDWIQNLLSDLSSTAEHFGMKHLLNPIYKVLEEGNQSMKWINQYEKGLSIEQIMKISIEDMIRSEGENV